MSLEIRAPTTSYRIADVTGGLDPVAMGVDEIGQVWLVMPAAVIGRLRVVALHAGRMQLDVELDGSADDVDFVDALGDQILLVGARADYDAESDYQHNAWVYDRTGQLQHSLFVGDGLDELQVADTATVWARYFDEGYYGDWAGVASLVAWDRAGTPTFRIQDIDGLSADADIAALNVASPADVWFICQGMLLHLEERRYAGAWSLAGQGSQAFAVAGQDVLLAGAWGPALPMTALLDAGLNDFIGNEAGEQAKFADELSALLKLQGRAVNWGDERDEAARDFTLTWLRLHEHGNTTVEGEFALRTAAGEAIEPTRVIGRAGRLYVLAGDTVHEVALADLAVR